MSKECGKKGKYIQIKAPPNSESLYYNYKRSYKFTEVDCGAYDSNNDAEMFSRSAFDKALFSDKLNLPREECAKKNKKKLR